MDETMTTFVGTETLTVVKCWCGLRHAVPKSLHDLQMREFNDGNAPTRIYCPLGHQYIPKGVTKCDRLSRRLNGEIARADQLRACLKDTEASLSATKGVVTRIKNRVGKGVCPCCNRTFKDLARHMHAKHPTYGDDHDRR